MDDMAGADPDFDRPAPKPAPRRGFRLIEVILGIVVAGILVGLFLPAPRTARHAARRAQCTNNLKQIALALHNYEAAYGALPPARTRDATGRSLHSWRTLILPFLDRQELYRSIDLAKPWDDPANIAAYRSMPSTFRCPAAEGAPNTTAYLAIVGPDNCLLRDEPRRFADITNDHATTLMLIEAGPASAVHWMAPSDADEALVLGFGPTTEFDHAGGSNAAFVDGSVQFIKGNLPASERRAMLRISGADPAQRPGKPD